MNCSTVETAVELLRSLHEMGVKKDEVGPLLKINKESLDLILMFKEQNRILFDVIFDGQYDDAIFKKMMKLKRSIEEGLVDSYKADVKFGTFMKELYIDPVIKN